MTARLHRWVLATSVALLGLEPSPEAAAAPSQVLKDEEAQRHFDRAQVHFQSEDYAAAIPELKAAYGLEPNPMLLYAWAQAERLAGSCSRAVELYRRFLETKPAAEQRQLAEANLLDCEAELPEPAPAPSPELDPLAQDDPSDPPTDVEPPRRWFADPAGGALLGVGVAAAATGGVVMGLGRRRGTQAPNADVEDDYLDIRAAATRMHTAGIITLGVGSALVLGAIIRYAIVAKRGRASGPRDAARWSPQASGLRVGSRVTIWTF